MNKTKDTWEVLFKEHNILDAIDASGFFEISSSIINEKRESRLMAKFDHRSNLPEIFRKNNLSILPTSRGGYCIGDFDAYVSQSFDSKIEPNTVDFPPEIESLRPENLFSEAAAINCAYVTGMIDAVAGGETRPTVSGRMGTSDFAFKIRRVAKEGFHSLKVENCQCEIDGGFESENSLVLLEAKNAIAEDFIIRQLYYPYRLWSGRINKKVVPVFLSYSNDIFHFFEYKFEDDADYNSIKLVRQRNFIIAPENIELEDIQKVLEIVKIVPEPDVPFPQADRFERVIDLLSIVAGGTYDKASITCNYDFDLRQTSYYVDAARYLGLLTGSSGYFSLTRAGTQVLKMSFKSKYLAFAKTILSHQVFNRACVDYLRHGAKPSNASIVEIMKDSRLKNVDSEATYQRRARTVLCWVEWILKLQR